jgi:hypothetical protein
LVWSRDWWRLGRCCVPENGFVTVVVSPRMCPPLS